MFFQRDELESAYQNLASSECLKKTALELNERLSKRYGCKVFLKREDTQLARSFKIRGAFNKIRQIRPEQLIKGVVTCSAGNHAQGVAYSCRFLKTNCCIFVPTTTPAQKRQRIMEIGGSFVNLHVTGNTFDDTLTEALKFAENRNMNFVHPFDDLDVVIGQSSVADEICQTVTPDIVICPIGGGGLISGQLVYRQTFGHNYRVIGVQPEGAPSMIKSLNSDQLVALDQIDTFVDGAAIKRPGQITFDICRQLLDQTLTVNENHLCVDLIEMYQDDGIIAEPAGALSVAALSKIQDQIRDKQVVCIVSGGNNDILRYSEFIERALIYRGLIHYFVIGFPQRPGALEEFIGTVLTDTGIDITRFEYLKKSNKTHGSVLIGFQLTEPEDLDILLGRLGQYQYHYQQVEPNNPLFNFLV